MNTTITLVWKRVGSAIVGRAFQASALGFTYIIEQDRPGVNRWKAYQSEGHYRPSRLLAEDTLAVCKRACLDRVVAGMKAKIEPGRPSAGPMGGPGASPARGSQP